MTEFRTTTTDTRASRRGDYFRTGNADREFNKIGGQKICPGLSM